MIISVSGKRGHGKDTVAKMIQYLVTPSYRKVPELHDTIEDWFNEEEQERNRYSGWENRKFSKKLKQGLELDFPNEFNEEKWENSGDEYREGIMPSLGITRREALQKKGVAHREINPMYWTNALMSEHKPIGSIDNEERKFHTLDQGTLIYPNWVISDVRFPDDEAKSIKDREGYIVRVNNPRVGWTGDHESETAMDNYPYYDRIFDNSSTLDYLMEQVRDFLTQYKII